MSCACSFIPSAGRQLCVSPRISLTVQKRRADGSASSGTACSEHVDLQKVVVFVSVHRAVRLSVTGPAVTEHQGLRYSVTSPQFVISAINLPRRVLLNGFLKTNYCKLWKSISS